MCSSTSTQPLYLHTLSSHVLAKIASIIAAADCFERERSASATFGTLIRRALWHGAAPLTPLNGKGMPLTGVLASCKRCAGHGVTRTVARVSKLVNSKRVQQGLHALRQAGVRAVERLYYAAGALAGVIDGVWRCMRSAQGCAHQYYLC